MHLHPEAFEPPLGGAADRAETDEPRGAPGELPGAEALVRDRAVAVHLAFAHVDVGLRSRWRLTANSSATVISATASALRPGARSTGMPAAVAPATSTLVGSPRVEPMAHERQVEHRSLARVGLADEHGRADFLGPLGELLGVVQPQRVVVDPRVDDDLAELLQRVEPRTAQRRRRSR